MPPAITAGPWLFCYLARTQLFAETEVRQVLGALVSPMSNPHADDIPHAASNFKLRHYLTACAFHGIFYWCKNQESRQEEGSLQVTSMRFS